MRALLSVLTCLAATATTLGGPALAEPATAAVAERGPGTWSGRGGPSIHSSDGVRGPSASPRSGGWGTRTPRTAVESWEVAAGVRYSAFTSQSDPARDPVRVHLLDIDPVQARLDLVTGSPVRKGRPVRGLVEAAGAVGGVNGDFFDIGDTGAPLGSSRDEQLGVRTGRAAGWNSAFWIDADGAAHVGTLGLSGRIKQRPALRVSHLNAPTVFPDRIGAYTPAWGTTLGARVTDGRTTHVREVVVERGRVVSNRRTLSRGRAITGRVLIGRGTGADRLATLRRGQRVGLSLWLTKSPRVAIAGSALLLQGGTRRVDDDVELHPRTAVGVDRDTGHLLLMVVDGRSESSSGATLVELADLMRAQGAEDALNLDGGGSSTMAGRDASGTLSVLNVPSDGRQRAVPNGLAVFER